MIGHMFKKMSISRQHSYFLTDKAESKADILNNSVSTLTSTLY